MFFKCRTPTCGYSTTKYTNFVKWSRRVDLCNAANMNNSVFAKCGGANKVVNGLSIFGESCLSIIEHNTPLSVDSKKVTHIALL